MALAGAGCSSQPPAPPEQTAAQSAAQAAPTCPQIEVEPSGRATQRFALGDATLRVTLDPRNGRASSRIELAHRMFSEDESTFDDFDRDGLAMGLRFGEAYFGEEHDIGLLQDEGITFGLVDGRPITPITSDSQPATFLDGAPVPTWNANETAAAQVKGIVDLEGQCASPDLIVPVGRFRLTCELPILICAVDFLVCLHEAHTLLAFRMCGKASMACLAGIPDVGGGCCDAANPTTACCDGSFCVSGAPSGVTCDANAGHCSNCTTPYVINGCTSDADCCPAVPISGGTGVPMFHCLPSGNGPYPMGPTCCRPTGLGDPCNTAADCPSSPNTACCTLTGGPLGSPICKAGSIGGPGVCWDTTSGFDVCNLPNECPFPQCFLPGTGGGGTGPGAGAGTRACTTDQLNANLLMVACTSGGDCCAGTECGHFTTFAGDYCACALRTMQCGASSGQGSAPCCPGETCQKGVCE